MEAMGCYEVNPDEGFDSTKFSSTINQWVIENLEQTKTIIHKACNLVLDSASIFEL